MALPAFNGQAQDLEGDAIPGVKVEVRREVGGLPLANIFSDRDGVSALGNPFTTNVLDNGRFRFHVAAGVYQVRVFTDAGFEVIWRYVAVQELIAIAGAVTDGHAVVWDGATGLRVKSLGRYPFLSRFEAITTTPRTLVGAEGGTFFGNAGADRTVTLPLTSASAGAAFGFYTTGNTLTVNTNGGNLLFEDGTSANTIVMASGSRMVVFCDGANWVVLAASFRLRPASEAETGVVSRASDAQIRSADASFSLRMISSASLQSAAAAVALADAATVAVNWDAGINFTLTVTANRVIGNPTNGQPGTWRTILAQGNDGTDRTITFGNQYLGELPTITDCDNARWYLLTIYCVTSTHFVVSHKRANG